MFLRLPPAPNLIISMKHGDPVYAHMVNFKEINQKKHLIQFLISTNLEKVRNSVESFTKCPTVLLKAVTSADVNLMNAKTFDTLFKDRTVFATWFTENGGIWK